MNEVGVKGFGEMSPDMWFGIVGPAGIPKPVVQKPQPSHSDYSQELPDRHAA